MDTNFEFIGLTRLGIKPECTAPEADALTIRLSKLLNFHLNALKNTWYISIVQAMYCNTVVIIDLPVNLWSD